MKAKRPKVEFKLEDGPKGMSLSSDGKLTWDIPADAKLGDHEVIVTIKDAAGQEIFHTFAIKVVK